MNTPMQAAVLRAIGTAVLTILVTGLVSYQHDRDVLNAIIVAASAALTVLGGRGIVEGSIDTSRQVQALNGNASVVTGADVAAPAQPVLANNASALLGNSATTWLNLNPQGAHAPPPGVMATHPLDMRG